MIASTLPKRMIPDTVRPLSIIRTDSGVDTSLTKIPKLPKVAGAVPVNILLTGNDKAALDSLSRFLSDTCQVFTARNENAMAKTMDKESIQLIISTIDEHENHGGDFCAQIKSSPHYCHIPVIFLIEENSLRSRILVLEYGADAFVERPFFREMLKAQIKNLITNRARVKDYYAHSLFAHMTTTDCSKEKEIFLTRLNEFIAENLPKKYLNVDLLARLMNMSRPTLYRKIRSVSNLTPNELINVTRLNRAAGLISSADHKIAEIAKMVGFHSRRNFGKAFLKHFSVTPSAYQRLKKAERPGVILPQ